MIITIRLIEIEIKIKTIPSDIAIDRFPFEVSSAIVVVIPLQVYNISTHIIAPTSGNARLNQLKYNQGNSGIINRCLIL